MMKNENAFVFLISNMTWNASIGYDANCKLMYNCRQLERAQKKKKKKKDEFDP